MKKRRTMKTKTTRSAMKKFDNAKVVDLSFKGKVEVSDMKKSKPGYAIVPSPVIAELAEELALGQIVGKDGLKRTPYITDQNNPQVKEYVDALKSEQIGTSIKAPIKPFGPDPIPEPSQSGYSHDQLLKALYWVFDFMDRALINFYLVGDTAKAVKAKQDLFGNRIQVAVRRLEWESGARRIADAFAMPIADKGTTVEYAYEGIPVILYVLEDSITLSGFDTAIYMQEYFKLPNPYEQFEKEFSWLK